MPQRYKKKSRISFGTEVSITLSEGAKVWSEYRTRAQDRV